MTLDSEDIQAIANAVWGKAIEAGFSAEEIIRLMSSVMLGKVSGAGTGTERFRDMANTKDRIVSVVDNSGNRTGITIDAVPTGEEYVQTGYVA